jgi:hypothetical protein
MLVFNCHDRDQFTVASTCLLPFAIKIYQLVVKDQVCPQIKIAEL